MECPRCELINPDSALRCDCGYDFANGKVVGSSPKLASLGARFWGQLFDEIVGLAIVMFGALTSRAFSGNQWAAGVWMLLWIVGAILYLLLSDGFKAGQSYGKRAAKTSVVDAHTGQPCTFGKSLLRNVMLHLLGLIDWIFIFGKKRQRLGDMVANTIVIEKRWSEPVDASPASVQ